MKDITSMGGITFYVVLLVFSYFYSMHVFWMLLAGLFLMYIVNVPLKLFFFKHRPAKMQYKAVWEKFEASAFPSVHSTRATFLALVFWTTQAPLLLKAFVILIALSIMVSRIWLKKHFLSDIIAGIVSGLVVFYVAEKVALLL
jgi:undecaprenyl-diphosphatase